MRKNVWTILAAFCVAAAAVFGMPVEASGQEQDPLTCDGLVANIVGSDGDDIIEGTNADDVIVGLGGNDQISGGNGSDVICGGDGADVLSGGNNDDVLDGGPGDDQISGGNGDDVVRGGDGNDTVGDVDDGSENGNDTISGGRGDDTLGGGRGDDTIDGNLGADTVDGGRGNDTCDDAETAVNCETETNNGEPDESVTIDEPVVDSVVAGDELFVRLVVGEAGPASIELFVDGVAVGVAVAPNFSAVVSLAGFADGPHVLQAAGESVAFSIARPPVGTLLVMSPAHGQAVGSKFAVVVEADGFGDGVQLAALVDGQVVGGGLLPSSGFRVDLGSVPAGLVEIEVVAGTVDAGVLASVVVEVEHVPDASAATASLYEQLDAGVISDDQFLSSLFPLLSSAPEDGDEDEVTIDYVRALMEADVSAEALASLEGSGEVVSVPVETAGLRAFATTALYCEQRNIRWVEGGFTGGNIGGGLFIGPFIPFESGCVLTVLPGVGVGAGLLSELPVSDRPDEPVGLRVNLMGIDWVSSVDDNTNGVPDELDDLVQNVWRSQNLFDDQMELDLPQGVVDNAREADQSDVPILDLFVADNGKRGFAQPWGGHPIRIQPKHIANTLIHELFHIFQWEYTGYLFAASKDLVEDQSGTTVALIESTANWGTQQYAHWYDPAPFAQALQDYGDGSTNSRFLSQPDRQVLAPAVGELTSNETYSFSPVFEWFDAHASNPDVVDQGSQDVFTSVVPDMIRTFSPFLDTPLELLAESVVGGPWENSDGPALARAWPAMWLSLYESEELVPGSSYDTSTSRFVRLVSPSAEFWDQPPSVDVAITGPVGDVQVVDAGSSLGSGGAAFYEIDTPAGIDGVRFVVDGDDASADFEVLAAGRDSAGELCVASGQVRVISSADSPRPDPLLAEATIEIDAVCTGVVVAVVRLPGDGSLLQANRGFTITAEVVEFVGDSDGDGVDDDVDNCPDDANALQVDSDGDGVGDACDPTPAGLDVAVAVTPFPPQGGDDVVAEFVVTNLKPTTSSDVRVAVEFPAGIGVVSFFPDVCTAVSDTLWDCTIGDLPAGDLGGVSEFDLAASFTPPIVRVLTGEKLLFGVGEGSATLTEELVLGYPGAGPGDPTGGNPFAVPCVFCPNGGSAGDPHLVSLDGLRFDLQTVGEKILAASDDGILEVQVRTRGFGGNRVSVNSAVAARVGLDVLEFGLGASVLLNGTPVEITTDAPLDLGGGAFVSKAGRYYNVVWPGAGDRPVLRVRIASSYINVSLLFPESMAVQFSGLLGDGDGDRSNDYQFRDGTVIPQPVTAATLHTVFADAWRISDAESLFTYPDGVGTADFTNLNFPSGGYVRLEDFDPAVVQAARVQCEQAGVTDPTVRDWCALDLIVTQDPSFLTGYLGALLPVGGGPLNTVRGSDGAPVLIDGAEDILASPDGSVLSVSLPAENKIITLDPVTGATADFATVEAPTDLAKDADGNLFVVTLGTLPSGPEGPGTGFVTRIDAVTGAQSVVAESLKLPVDVEITPDGSLLYVHERGLNWFGGAASGVRTVDMATGVSTRVFNAYRLNPMAGLAMDGTGRAFWETRNLRFSHTPADGVTELAGVDNRRSTITAPDGTMFYTRIGGPFGPCDSNNNVFLHVEETDQAGVPLGGRIFIAGGVDKVGFSDSTFADPLGRMCQTNLALTLAGSRIYINDAGNDAIRYLTYNP